VAKGLEYHLADISPSHGLPLSLEKQLIQTKELKAEIVAKFR
jgi:hypothetical protein